MFVSTHKEDFSKYYSWAVIFHCFIVLLIFALTEFLDLSRTPLKIKDVQEIKASVRVDVVAMPKLTLKELEKVELSKPAEPEPAVPEKTQPTNETSKVEYKKVKKKVDMKNLLSQYSQKKVETKKVVQKKKLNTDLKNIILEGNKISQGSSTVGEKSDNKNEVFINYIQSFPDIVRPYWKLPSYLLEQDLRCRLRLYISSVGKIIKIEIFESSGELEYDNKAIEAVRKSSPFPKPPAEVKQRVLQGDVILGFPL
ncbi:MAG: hypothetical protein CME62_10645 [Halobacteriovoraceae bacterium]|nr:hypothetical protein [Halobacteriovoraceae bacterium]|tara:strand:- start:25756 stop:26517 length:762 start_codon:yes stop_codon:yes gene_type:complete